MNCFKGKIVLTVICFILLICSVQFAGAIPAFPGAEGFGAESIGGRGGMVIKVTNLNDSGPGSFRAAAEATGSRIVVFDVSGTILINAKILVLNPFITIAGETSPGGVAIAGHKVVINTHDVIIRHMRFRVGTSNVVYERDVNGNIVFYDVAQGESAFPVTPGTCAGSITTEELGYPCPIKGGVDPGDLDNLLILGKFWGKNEAYNIIIDHCSASWGVDETFTLTGGVMATTVQWCIISEGLVKAGHGKGEHSKGIFISGKYRYNNQISLHHNYIAHNIERSPLIQQPDDADRWVDQTTVVDGINNVTYDWKGAIGPRTDGTPYVNWVYNYARPGLNGHPWSYELEMYAKPWTTAPRPLLYVKGNIGSSRTTQGASDWNVGWGYEKTPCPTTWKKNTSWPTPKVTTAEMSESVANCILTAVGATAPVRDSVDTRVVADFAAGTGTFKINVTYPDDYPVFATIAPPPDTDNDGMPDSWENAQGFNPGVNDSALDQDKNGYTNIEEYLHYLSAASYQFDAVCMPGPARPSIKAMMIN